MSYKAFVRRNQGWGAWEREAVPGNLESKGFGRPHAPTVCPDNKQYDVRFSNISKAGANGLDGLHGPDWGRLVKTKFIRFRNVNY